MQVSDGTDGLPVWIGIDPEAGKVYKVYASGMAQGFGDGRMLIINGMQFIEGRVGSGEQLTQGRHIALTGESGTVLYEVDPVCVVTATQPDQPIQS